MYDQLEIQSHSHTITQSHNHTITLTSTHTKLQIFQAQQHNEVEPTDKTFMVELVRIHQHHTTLTEPSFLQ